MVEHNLDNAGVTHCADGFIEVLTTAGQIALDGGAFYHPDPEVSNCPIDPNAHLERVFLRGDWRSGSQRARVEEFCRDVGHQLFAEYLRRKDYKWGERKIAASSFGMHGLGLNLAFSHSVPKASLPLLWADGKVQFEGARVDWKPLFANAEI